MAFAPENTPLVPFLLGLAFAQQPPPQHETIVVTGTYEPLSLDEIDRAVRSCRRASKALVLNSLVDLLRLDPSLDLQARAPDGVQTDLSIRGSSFGRPWCCSTACASTTCSPAITIWIFPCRSMPSRAIEVLEGSGSRCTAPTPSAA